VFLEVWDGERWDLLDPEAQQLYEQYDPRQRILPGDRYAYDKGIDPYELVLSTRWEDWQAQTRAWVATVDLATLPVTGARRIGATAFIAGNNPGWGVASGRLAQLGWKVGHSGNTDFDQWLPDAVGAWLVVLSVGGTEPLPEPYRSSYEPQRFADLARVHRGQDSWTDVHVAADGTHVVLVYGSDAAALAAALGRLDL
jgi:hypothetical protein